MARTERSLVATDLDASVALTTAYANGDYTLTAQPGVSIVRAIHFTGAIVAGTVLTVELWDSTLDRQYVPATAITVVAGATAGVSTGVLLVDCAIPRAAALKLKAKLSAGTGTLTTATLIREQ